MAIIDAIELEPMVGDPDDHRPDSRWTVIVDPTSADGSEVRDLVLIREHMAPGDAIPLHTHSANEVVVVDAGSGTYRLGEERRRVDPGACVFIPAGTPHGLLNDVGGELRLTAVFPSSVIDITYLERNPAPGTEGDDPQPPMVYDPRA